MTNRPQHEMETGIDPLPAADSAPDPTAESQEKRQFLQGALSVFILFHIIAIVCWAFPFRVAPITDVKNFVRPYMVWSGLFQSWDFFAPNPKQTNSFVEAVVLTQSHRQKVWAFPRMEQLGYFDRYREERYRKFTEILPLTANAAVWPGVAQHIAGIFQDAEDPPEAILLIDFQGRIQPGHEVVPTPNIFYEYLDNVPPEDVH